MFQRPERLGWESEERAGPDSSPHLLCWPVKLCCCYEKPQHGHWQWSFTFLSGHPTLKGDSIRKLWTDHLSPCGEFAWARVHGGGKRPSPPSPPPCSSLSQCFPQSLPLVWGRMPFWTPLTPPLDALLGPVEEPSCPPVHGFPYRDGCHGFIVHRFVR